MQHANRYLINQIILLNIRIISKNAFAILGTYLFGLSQHYT